MTSLTTPPLLQKEDAKILEQVQRIAARYVYNDYTDLVVMVKESIEDGPYVARLCILFKMQHKLVNIDPSGSRTRGSRGLIQERINSEVYYNSFFPRTIWEWKTLSGDVTVAASLGAFRASLTVRCQLHVTT